MEWLSKLTLEKEDFIRLAERLASVSQGEIDAINAELDNGEPQVESASKEFVKAIRDCCPGANNIRYQILVTQLRPIFEKYRQNIAADEREAYGEVQSDLTELQRGNRPARRAPYLEWLFAHHEVAAHALIGRLRIYDAGLAKRADGITIEDIDFNQISSESEPQADTEFWSNPRKLILASVLAFSIGGLIGAFGADLLRDELTAVEHIESDGGTVRVTEQGGGPISVDGSGFDYLPYETLEYFISNAEIVSFDETDDFRRLGRCAFAVNQETVIALGEGYTTAEYLRVPAKIFYVNMSNQQIRDILVGLNRRLQGQPNDSHFYISRMGGEDDCGDVLNIHIDTLSQEGFDYHKFISEIIVRSGSGYKDYYIMGEIDLIEAHQWVF